MSIRLPRLLDAGLHEIARLTPLKLSLTQNMTPLSSAVLTLAPDAPPVRVGLFAELYDPSGSAGIFRVTDVTQTAGNGNERTVRLEHGLCTLADGVLPGYTELAGLTTAQALAALLSRQDAVFWTPGECDWGDAFAYSFENENLLRAVLSLAQPLAGTPLWSFDQSVFPWRLSLRRASEQDACECRAGRNLASARITVDRKNLCTRLYPRGYGEGADQLTIAPVHGGVPYLDADTASTFGIVSAMYTETSITDAATLLATARTRLEKLKSPVVTVSADAADLSDVTGEPCDRLAVGALCRLPIPDLGVSLSERIVSLTRDDVYAAPERVRVALANKGTDAADTLAALSRKASVAELYSQGAASEYAASFADNADPAHPAVMRFFIDEGAIHVNSVHVRFTLSAFRAYSRGAGAGGSGTAQTDAKAWSDTVVTGYALDASGNDMTYTDSGGGTTAAPHYHKMKHDHVVRVSFDLPRLSVSLASHTHPIEYGIYEGETAADVAIRVDGNPVPASAVADGAFDAAAYLARDASGRLLRGAWHTVSFTPDAMTRIDASVHVRTFIRSLTGAGL